MITKQELEEYLLKATQNGKNETSGLYKDLKKDLNEFRKCLVPRTTLFWILGTLVAIFTGIIGLLYLKQENLSNYFNHTFTEVREDIAEIKTSVDWLRAEKIKEGLPARLLPEGDDPF